MSFFFLKSELTSGGTVVYHKQAWLMKRTASPFRPKIHEATTHSQGEFFSEHFWEPLGWWLLLMQCPTAIPGRRATSSQRGQGLGLLYTKQISTGFYKDHCSNDSIPSVCAWLATRVNVCKQLSSGPQSHLMHMSFHLWSHWITESSRSPYPTTKQRQHP